MRATRRRATGTANATAPEAPWSKSAKTVQPEDPSSGGFTISTGHWARRATREV